MFSIIFSSEFGSTLYTVLILTDTSNIIQTIVKKSLKISKEATRSRKSKNKHNLQKIKCQKDKAKWSTRQLKIEELMVHRRLLYLIPLFIPVIYFVLAIKNFNSNFVVATKITIMSTRCAILTLVRNRNLFGIQIVWTLLVTCEGAPGSTHNCQSHPQVADRESRLYYGRSHVIIQNAHSWTIVGTGFVECHAPSC